MVSTSMSSLLAYLDMPVTVALFSCVAASVLAWAEFLDVGRKIMRYSVAINKLKALIIWWDSLPDVEKASTVNITRLVLEGESIISSEHVAWKSTCEADADQEAEHGG